MTEHIVGFGLLMKFVDSDKNTECKNGTCILQYLVYEAKQRHSYFFKVVLTFLSCFLLN